MLKTLKFVPAQITLFLVIGIILGSYIDFSPTALIASLIGIFLVLMVSYAYANKINSETFVFNIIVYFTSFAIGISSYCFKQPKYVNAYFGSTISENAENYAIGEITILKRLKPTKSNLKFIGEVNSINQKETKGKILIYIKNDTALNSLNVDSRIRIAAKIYSIPEPLNPFGFNYKKYLKNEGILYQTNLNASAVKVLKHKRTSIKGIAANIRDKIVFKLKENGFKGQELAVINALVLGQREFISQELLDDYVNAGAIHILAVSGLHIGIILLLLQFLFSPLNYFKNSKRLKLILIVGCLWLYAVMAGLSPSVVRAVSMFTAVVIGLYSNRNSNVYNSLIISMFFLLLIHPFYLFKVGFQLSYLAVFSIVWLQPKFENLIKFRWWFPRKIWQLFTVSLAAQLGVLPLSLFYFHQFPSLFFISNLVIVPFLGIILTIGIIVISLSLANLLPAELGVFYNFLIAKMNGFIQFVSNQEAFVFTNISFSIFGVISSYVLIVLFFKWIEKPKLQRFQFLLLSIIVIQIIVLFEKNEGLNSEEFVVFYKNKETIFTTKVGEKLQVFKDTLGEPKDDNTISSYILSRQIKDVEYKGLEFNYLSVFGKDLLIVDSLGIYKGNLINPSIILLRQSPKINLNRLINMKNPSLIIADGSNYTNYIKKWEETCIKKKTPFFNMKKNGAFILN